MVYLFIIIGLFFGSFYYVVGDRLSKDESIVKPRSHCEKCNHYLNWYELIPIISYIFLKGKCKNCKTKLSITYPLLELLTGILFGISYLVSDNIIELITLITISSLISIIFVSDFKYLYILDIPLYIAYATIIISNFILTNTRETLIAVLTGCVFTLIMFILKLVGDKMTKRESLGLGDIKLAFIFGLTLGFQVSFVALILASIMTLPFAIYYTYKKQNKEIPFGPFLIMSVFITFIFKTDILNFLNNLFI